MIMIAYAVVVTDSIDRARNTGFPNFFGILALPGEGVLYSMNYPPG
jgi:hypothetical protein